MKTPHLAVAPAGPVDRAEQALADREEARAEKARLRIEGLRRRIPPIYRDARWEDLAGVQIRYQRGEDEVPGDLREVLARWASNAKARTLFLAGPVGTGKTYAATALALRCPLEEPSVDVRWWSVAALLDAIRPNQPDAETTWSRARTCGLLVLDDLAHTRPTEWAAERIWMLVNHRVEHALRTVITTNADWRDLEQCWGKGTLDRLRDGGVVVRFVGKSQRKPLW
jgi:DNA replication protein DnaC